MTVKKVFTRAGRIVLVANNECTNRCITFDANPSKQTETADDVRKAKAAHSVFIFHIHYGTNGWEAILEAPEN